MSLWLSAGQTSHSFSNRVKPPALVAIWTAAARAHEGRPAAEAGAGTAPHASRPRPRDAARRYASRTADIPRSQAQSVGLSLRRRRDSSGG